MSDKAQPEVVVTPPAAAPAVTPPAAPAPTPAAPPAAPPPPAAASAATPPPEARPVANVPTRKLIGDEEDIPADVDLLEMSARGLKSRLQRHTKKELKDRFGTDDPDAIKSQLDELAQYKAREEEQRLAQMNELERERELRAKAEARATAAETRAAQVQENQVVERTDRRIMRYAAEYLDPDYLDVELPKLARHIANLSEDELRDPDAMLTGYFEQRVKDKPKIGKAYGAAPPEPPAEGAAPAAGAPPAAPPTKIVPFSNGANAAPPAQLPSSGEVLQKTAAPGKPNSMTDAEYRQFKTQQGIRY